MLCTQQCASCLREDSHGEIETKQACGPFRRGICHFCCKVCLITTTTTTTPRPPGVYLLTSLYTMNFFSFTVASCKGQPDNTLLPYSRDCNVMEIYPIYLSAPSDMYIM